MINFKRIKYQKCLNNINNYYTNKHICVEELS